jgi:lambda repressor-like predicted transcriptional regulator
MLAQHRREEEERRDTLTVVHLRPGLWDPASGRFNMVRLRAAIVSRGWTVAEFAATAEVSRACLYNALRAWATSDRTAIRIAATLATREPMAALATE